MPRGIRAQIVGAGAAIDRTIFVARETFMTVIDNVPMTIVKGTTVRAGHALHKGREMLFAPLKVEYDVAGAAQEPEDVPPDPEPKPVVPPVSDTDSTKKLPPAA